MAVQILTDSTSCMDENLKNEYGIRILSLNVSFEDESFKETEISNDVFYKKMEEKGIPKSSQPSINDMIKEMKSVVINGDSLLCIFISSKMSGTYSTAHVARNIVLEEYTDAKIEIFDSGDNCMQLGYAAVSAAKAAKEGANLEQVKLAAKENLKKSRFLFIPENLVYLRKGGRIGGAGALIGNILKIIPILTVENGVTTVYGKVRTKKKAVTTMLNRMLEEVKHFGLGEITVHHINCYDEAKKLAAEIEDKLNIKPLICDIGPVIGLHVGPGSIGIVYYTKEDLR